MAHMQLFELTYNLELAENLYKLSQNHAEIDLITNSHSSTNTLVFSYTNSQYSFCLILIIVRNDSY